MLGPITKLYLLFKKSNTTLFTCIYLILFIPAFLEMWESKFRNVVNVIVMCVCKLVPFLINVLYPGHISLPLRYSFLTLASSFSIHLSKCSKLCCSLQHGSHIQTYNPPTSGPPHPGYLPHTACWGSTLLLPCQLCEHCRIPAPLLQDPAASLRPAPPLGCTSLLVLAHRQ